MNNSSLESENFIANASHELRSPIAIIRGFAELLHEHPTLNQEIVKDVSEKILRTSLRLEKLVKSLLTLSDIQSLQKTAMHPVNLLFLIEHCKEIVLSRFSNAKISIHGKDPEIYILGEEDLLELCAINLMENAIKYSFKQPIIEVTIFQNDQDVMINFQDQGIGISKDHLGHIFERFYSADKSQARRLGGAGLGLSLVKTILEKHNGSISVSSELGKGSIFTVILPR